MSLSVLNNIPSLVAQNQLQVTNSNLQNTLFQLSSGSRINTGADDAAGLAIANGLQANISALQQSSHNASDGVGKLQVADGALSQVTTLLNRAVTLASESANGTVSQLQRQALNAEFTSIQAEITRIGNATNFNGTAIFSTGQVADPNQFTSTATNNITATTALTATDATTVSLGTGASYTFTPGTAGSTLVTGNTTVTPNSTILNGGNLTLQNAAGSVTFTADPMQYAGATAKTVASVTAGGEQLSVTNASGTMTYTAPGGASTVGAWLSGFNTAGASFGVSAYLDSGGHLTIQSNSGITAVTPNGAATTLFGALTAVQSTENYGGATATGGVATVLAAADSLSVTNANGTASYAGNAGQTIGDWLAAFNSSGAAVGISATLDGTGHIQVQSTAPITAAPTVNGAFTGDFGALTGTQTASTDTVGDLMNQINTSGLGLTASIDGNGHLNVSSSNGNITVVSNTLPGTTTAVSTVQDLINGINSSGLGVTAGLANVTNPNQLSGATSVTTGTALTSGTLTFHAGTADASGNYADTVTYTAAAGQTVADLITAINTSGKGFYASLSGGASGALQIVDNNRNSNIAVPTVNTMTGVIGAVTAGAATQQLVITDPLGRGDLNVTNADAVLGFDAGTGGNSDAFYAPQVTGAAATNIFISDGNVSNTYNTISVSVGQLDDAHLGTQSISTDTLYSATSDAASIAAAKTTLTDLNSAISQVANLRGGIGAGINRLNSAVTVMNTQVQNLTAAASAIKDADVGQVVANLSKYQVLEQTGIASLAQANSQEQAVLKLLQ